MIKIPLNRAIQLLEAKLLDLQNPKVNLVMMLVNFRTQKRKEANVDSMLHECLASASNHIRCFVRTTVDSGKVRGRVLAGS